MVGYIIHPDMFGWSIIFEPECEKKEGKWKKRKVAVKLMSFKTLLTSCFIVLLSGITNGININNWGSTETVREKFIIGGQQQQLFSFSKGLANQNS